MPMVRQRQPRRSESRRLRRLHLWRSRVCRDGLGVFLHPRDEGADRRRVRVLSFRVGVVLSDFGGRLDLLYEKRVPARHFATYRLYDGEGEGM